LDVAKGVFQVHGVRAEPGEPVALARRLRRAQLEPFLARLPPSLIGLEACGAAHHWARVAARHGHAVRLVKSEADQALLMLHRTRASFVAKRTAAANQLRAAFAEFGITAAAGARGFGELLALVEGAAETFLRLPAALRLVLAELAQHWRGCAAAVRRLDAAIAASVRRSERAQRLLAVPGIGPLAASAIDALLPDPQVFRSGRHFAAWTGLTPREDSSGTSVRRGPITKRGDGYLRRLLVLGATAYLARVRRGRTKDAAPWVVAMAAHPKRKLAAVALANKTARIAWALLARGEAYRAPAAAAA
jgi:transposase